MNELSWSFNHLASWWPFSSSNGRSYIVDLFNFWLALGRPSSISSFFFVLLLLLMLLLLLFLLVDTDIQHDCQCPSWWSKDRNWSALVDSWSMDCVLFLSISFQQISFSTLRNSKFDLFFIVKKQKFDSFRRMPEILTYTTWIFD